MSINIKHQYSQWKLFGVFFSSGKENISESMTKPMTVIRRDSYEDVLKIL